MLPIVPGLQRGIGGRQSGAGEMVFVKVPDLAVRQ